MEVKIQITDKYIRTGGLKKFIGGEAAIVIRPEYTKDDIELLSEIFITLKETIEDRMESFNEIMTHPDTPTTKVVGF